MERFVVFLENSSNRLPGPGKFILSALISDRQALRVLVACMASLLAATLQPPILSLSVPELQQGLRDPSSGVPIQIAAAYLLLAVLTLAGGVSGDLFGRKRFLLLGLAGILITNLGGMFLYETWLYRAIHALNLISSVLIMPMTVALVTVAFSAQGRPFAYGALFACQGIGMVLAASLNGIFAQTNFIWVAFIPAITFGIIAIRLVFRDATESRAPKTTSRHDLFLNLAWAAAIFGLVYGLLAYGGGITGRNMFLIIAICAIGFIIGYRWVAQRLEKQTKLYNIRDMSFAIFAGIMLSVGQGALFFQIGAFFQQIQNIGPVRAGLQLLPYILAMMLATVFIARLALIFDARRIITAGLALMGLGLASMFFVQVSTPYWQLIIPLGIIGFGLGIAAPARTTVVLTNATPGMTGMAAGVNTAAGQSGFTLGILISSYMVTYFADMAFLRQLEQNGAPAAVIQSVAAIFQKTFASAISGNLTALPDEIAKQVVIGFSDAFAAGMVVTFILLAIVLLAAAIAVLVGMNKGLKASLIDQPLSEISPSSESNAL